ncbi:hypothetical protein [Bradyrhizobium genosp. P]|uniref:hypothetical protein n=1 Tax=Bradyrhizobium genosp. P TaxID=83641 RepID=UPI003CF641C8
MLNIISSAARRPGLRQKLLSGTALLGTALIGLADPTPARADQQFLKHGSLVISSSTYDATQGAVAALAIGTPLPGPSTAVAGNSYLTIWNNASVDGSFGVTSAIQLTDIDLSNGKVFRSMQMPTDQVVTSFSSKSELGLHVINKWPAVSVVLVGYANAGVGKLDVSNSDALPGQDPTNPVTVAFGPGYAFRRTIVSVDEKASITYTPTLDYGGNNGRSALLGSNGLYYMVGNANNGNASTFAPNGTNPDVTETTGLVVVNPINSSVVSATIPSATSSEVDPSIQYPLNKVTSSNPLGLDKPGKDNNYRGITEFGGALYFTKGSGSNGMDTVYTVKAPNSLPTLYNAATSTIAVVPGFPTDSARATNGNYTPFAVFFANPTTVYVSDEGTGSTTDTSSHAGLQKWTLGSNGSWHLQYVLTKGLIGVVDGNVTGYAGPWPAITTIGLRNLTGRINRNGTVTLWATTSTKSASGDNGADPNKVVEITDQIAATQLSQVGNESFTTVAGPVYGTVFRGVGFVE